MFCLTIIGYIGSYITYKTYLRNLKHGKKTITMYSPTTVSIGPIRTQKGGGVRKVRKCKTKRRRKGRQSTKLKINVKRLIKQILSAK